MSNIANIGTINNRVGTISIGSTASSMGQPASKMTNISGGAQIINTAASLLFILHHISAILILKQYFSEKMR